MRWRGNRIKPHSWNYVPSAWLRMLTFDTTNPDLTRPQMRRGRRPHLTVHHYVHVSSVIYVFNVAGWLQNLVRLEHFSCLSLAWLPCAVIHRLSRSCLTVDANWPPFPLSSAQMKRFPASRDGTCHNVIWQIKKLTAVTLPSSAARCLISDNDDFSSPQLTAKHERFTSLRS